MSVTRRGNSNISNNGLFGKVGRINLQAVYSLQKASDGEIIYKGHIHANSLFDFSNQEFSKIRIVKDTEEKTSKELAENIRIDVISFLKTID
ncbi:hypothetical protein [Candidatus Liberibacter sp.]|uniref:hypothetical protein n=1 Tax=Candidatus Liberibacter sp. TaxID=34022 RepID=UPI0015F6029E|nr:hypothetical protein [Candidatus Liberibacter sp.]MBA5723961.1 hypothetical protein [Candidatus Liberibacter sp.]